MNVRARALHASFIGLMRHFASGNLRNAPDVTGEDNLILWIKKLILSTTFSVALFDYDNTEIELEKFIKRIKSGFNRYGEAFYLDGDTPLMYPSAAIVPGEVKSRSFPTPTSMRGVDEDCDVQVIIDN